MKRLKILFLILEAMHALYAYKDVYLTDDENTNIINVSYPLNSNVSCIYLQGAFTLFVPEKYSDSGYIDVPTDLSTSGDCSYNSSVQMIKLGFLEQWGLALFFSKDTQNDIRLTSLTVQYANSSASKNGSEEITTFNMDIIGNPRSNTLSFYQCQSNLSLTSKEEPVAVTARGLQYRAWAQARDPGDGAFSGEFLECQADDDDSVNAFRLALGAGLMGLMLLTFVSIYCHQRHNPRRQYDHI